MTQTLERSYPRLRLPGLFVRRMDMHGAVLHDADLAGADATEANFRGSDFLNANLDGTILRGADLTGVRNLTHEQLSRAVIDEATVLPDYIDRARLAALREAGMREAAE